MGDVKQSAISYTKERCLKAAIFELVDDHETLKREANELREHNRYLESRVSEESDYAALLSRYNALVEAVKALRNLECGIPEMGMLGAHEIITEAARAEVDRMLEEVEG